ncbi:metallophosphatase domain-containing protein [Ferruginibacter profundus]
MKFVAISDTHGQHNSLVLPTGDVLIHAGDVSMKGDEIEIANFLSWFSAQNFQHKIFIAGNHDFYFEREPQDKILKLLPENIIYLNDSGISINNTRIWGSPITPWFFNWAFNRYRGESINKHWDLIPDDTDIIITHGPVLHTLDMTSRGEHTGCKDLLDRVRQINPMVHICGHIHEAYGTTEKEGIRFINASLLDSKYKLTKAPIVFEL